MKAILALMFVVVGVDMFVGLAAGEAITQLFGNITTAMEMIR